MKKVIGIIVIVALCFGGFVVFKAVRDHQGKSYFLQITGKNMTERIEKQLPSGKEYKYNEKAYDENGKELVVDFFGAGGKKLTVGKYLKISYNTKNGVLGYDEVQENEIPDKALEKIKANATKK